MAEGKKGFILYADQKELFSQLTDAKAGKLIKHIFKYVNDESPISKDLIINLAFTPIKIQLKRDLNKWDSERKSRSDAGKKGMANRWAKHNKSKQTITNDNSVIPVITNITDKESVNVNDNVNDNVKESVINKNTHPALIAFRNNVFKESKEMDIDEKIALKFFEYWSAIEINSKQFLFQVTDNFALTNKLKGWVKIEDKNKPKTFDKNWEL